MACTRPCRVTSVLPRELALVGLRWLLLSGEASPGLEHNTRKPTRLPLSASPTHALPPPPHTHNSRPARFHAQVYVRRVRKYLGAYFMHLDGQVDAIVFSAGGRVRSARRGTAVAARATTLASRRCMAGDCAAPGPRAPPQASARTRPPCAGSLCGAWSLLGCALMTARMHKRRAAFRPTLLPTTARSR